MYAKKGYRQAASNRTTAIPDRLLRVPVMRTKEGLMMTNEEPVNEADDMPTSQGPFSESIQHTPISARVPKTVTGGVVSTATMILQTDDVFVIDFLSAIARPQQVTARVVVTASTFCKMLFALEKNLEKYEQQYGTLNPHTASRAALAQADPANEGNSDGQAKTGEKSQKHCPAQSVPPQNRIADLYEDLALPDHMLGGKFANTVMISHTGEEFAFDFITNFFPRSVVTNRVFLAAGRIPSLLKTMRNSLQKYQQSQSGQEPPGSPPAS